jgi:hypothetical protein
MSGKLDQQCINTLRLLSVEMVQKANCGHPRLPLGAALKDGMVQVLHSNLPKLTFIPRQHEHSLNAPPPNCSRIPESLCCRMFADVQNRSPRFRRIYPCANQGISAGIKRSLSPSFAELPLFQQEVVTNPHLLIAYE